MNELVKQYDFNNLKLKIQPRANNTEAINIDTTSSKLPSYEDAL